jgi:hypothetical protein
MANDQLKEELELRKGINRAIADHIKLQSIESGRATEAAADAQRARLLEDIEETDNATKNLNTRTAQYRQESTQYRGALRQEAQAGTDAFEGLRKLTEGLSTGLFEARQRLMDFSAERRESVSAIAEIVGGSSRAFMFMANDATSAGEQIRSSLAGTTEKVNDYVKTLGGLAGETGTFSDAQARFIGGVNATDEAFLNAQGAMTEFYGLATGFRRDNNGQLISDSFFKVQGVPLMDVMGGTIEAFRPFLDLLQDDNLRKPFTRDMLNPKDTEESLKELKRMDVAIKAYKLSNDQVTQFVRESYIRTGKANTDYFNEVVKAAEMGQNAFGYNAQLIIHDISRMSQNIDTFGFRTADEFAKIAAKAHDVHISVSELQGVMGKFDTFESAAQTVGQLNAALGTNFDAMELMHLKYEDPAMMLERLREGLMSTGKSFEDIPITYKRMITQQLSISHEALRGLMDGSVQSLEELTQAQQQQQDEMGKMDAGAQQKALDARVEMRVKMSSELISSAEDLSRQAERAAKQYANVGLELSETAERTNDAVNKFASDYLEKVAPAYERVATGIRAVEAGVVQLGAITAKKALETVGENASKIATAILDQVFATFEKEVMTQLSAVLKEPDLAKIRAGLTQAGSPGTSSTAEPTKDLYVSPGGSTVVTANFGEMNERSFELDKRDALVAKPPAEPAPAAAPAPAQRNNLPAVSDAIRASLQGVGTSLRIELDVGQLTDLVLRDIMLNKPNVFGGIG